MPLSKIPSEMKAILPSQGGLVLLAGHADGADGSVTLADASHGITISRSGEGVYVVQLPGKGSLTYVALFACVEDADQKLVAQITARDESARTFTITAFENDDIPVATDIVSGKLHFMALVDQR